VRDRFIGRERAKQTESEREGQRERKSTAYARGVKYYRTLLTRVTVTH